MSPPPRTTSFASIPRCPHRATGGPLAAVAVSPDGGRDLVVATGTGDVLCVHHALTLCVLRAQR